MGASATRVLLKETYDFVEIKKNVGVIVTQHALCRFDTQTHIESRLRPSNTNTVPIMSASDLDLDSIDESIQSFKLKKANGQKKLMACFPISGVAIC